MIKIALLVLTLTVEGDVRLTLTETASPADCSEARETVADILTGAGIKVIAAICGETELRLTPFEHGAGPEDEVHRFRVELPPNGGYTITPLSAEESCDAAPAVFCTRSSQMVMPGN